MNVVLTGFMATGKSTIGKEVARISKFKFIDTDEMIVKKAGMEINDIFAKYGEKQFREIEKDVIKEVAQMDNMVVATGGGVVLDRENIDLLRGNGIIINLNPDFSVIEERALKARESRPLMKNESMEEIKKRFDERKPYYDNCDEKVRVVSGRTPHSYAMEILKITEGKV